MHPTRVRTEFFVGRERARLVHLGGYFVKSKVNRI